MENHRQMTFMAFVAALLATFSGLHAEGSVFEHFDRPNIIIVLTDDQRWDSAGFSSEGVVWTPGLDKLRARSMQFTRAYSAFALCSPSRAAILTGQYGTRNGINGLGGRLRRPGDSIANMLHENGYLTAICGKWHMETTPKEAGFDWAVTFSGNGAWFGRSVNRNGEMVKPKELVDKYCTSQSVGFLRERDKDRPFFLWHCTQLPHMDHQHAWPASEANLNRYKEGDMPLPTTWKGGEAGKPEWLRTVRNRTQAITYGYDKDPNAIRRHTRAYRAAVSDVDDALQGLWTELDLQNLWSNTIVIFMSDNGWMLGEHGLTSKVLAYEPSARIPMLIAVPGLAGGRVCDRLVSNLDIAPTLLELVRLPVSPACHGRSLRELLANPEAPFRTGFLYEGVGGYGGVPPMGAWITEREKFILTWKNWDGSKPGFTECYNLQDDPEEKSNRPIKNGMADEYRKALAQFKVHLEVTTKPYKNRIEQDGGGQPATRPVSK